MTVVQSRSPLLNDYMPINHASWRGGATGKALDLHQEIEGWTGAGHCCTV